MSAETVGLADPEAAWNALSSNPKTMLIDCRTQAEWAFVGVPDLSPAGKAAALIEWKRYPDMAVNADFAAEALAVAESSGADEIYFICRSGVRSLDAAATTLRAAQAAGRSMTCVNVVEGFEGDLDPAAHRGALNGWKARGLPWRQS